MSVLRHYYQFVSK